MLMGCTHDDYKAEIGFINLRILLVAMKSEMKPLIPVNLRSSIEH